jgi:quercetin dioxygenase-like cupin family protein
MKTAPLTIALLMVASGLSLPAVQAQQPADQAHQLDVKRTNLVQHDLSIAGREVVQVRVDIAPGVLAANHSHPGEEIAYVIEGVLEYRLEGRAPVTVKAGETLFIPAGTIHSARNVGTGNAAELATYIVEKGKPLVTLAE